MLSAPSGATSATIATIFDVPMSRPTITFFASFTIAIPSPCLRALRARRRFLRRALLESGHARRESVAIAQVHVLDARARRARARRSCVRRRRRSARAARSGSSRPSSIASAPPAPFARQPPAAARREPDAFERERERRERLAPFAIACRHLRGAAVRAVELRQLAVVVGDEHLALRIDERRVVPARDRRRAPRSSRRAVAATAGAARRCAPRARGRARRARGRDSS